MAQFIRSDLEFILEQIRIAEAHAAGTPLQQLIANPTLSLGLRTVDGSDNNLVQGQSEFGAADNPFPRMTTPDFRDAEGGTLAMSRPAAWSPTRSPAPSATSSSTRPTTTPRPLPPADADGDERRLHPQRHARRRPVGAVQLLVHAVRPVLRPRPRPGEQGRQRHGLHPAAAGRSALRRRQPDQLHGADPGHQPARPRRHRSAPPTTSTSTPTRRRRSSTRTRPTPRTPRTRCSCASTCSTRRQAGRDRAAAREPRCRWRRRVLHRRRRPDSVASPPGPSSRRRRATLLGIELTDADVTNVPLLATDAYGNFLPGANGFPRLVMSDSALVEGNPGSPDQHGRRHAHRPRLPRRHRQHAAPRHRTAPC